jgi:hypothetical protein
MRAFHPEKPQLRMKWPSTSRGNCPPVNPPAQYAVRTFRIGDEQAFLTLMSYLDFVPWDEAKLALSLSADAGLGLVARGQGIRVRSRT